MTKKPPAPARTCACGVQGLGKSRECHTAYYGDDDVFSLGPHGAVGPTIDCQCSCHAPARPALARYDGPIKSGMRFRVEVGDRSFRVMVEGVRVFIGAPIHADYREGWFREHATPLDTPAPQPAPEIPERALALLKEIVEQGVAFNDAWSYLEVQIDRSLWNEAKEFIKSVEAKR